MATPTVIHDLVSFRLTPEPGPYASTRTRLEVTELVVDTDAGRFRLTDKDFDTNFERVDRYEKIQDQRPKRRKARQQEPEGIYTQVAGNTDNPLTTFFNDNLTKEKVLAMMQEKITSSCHRATTERDRFNEFGVSNTYHSVLIDLGDGEEQLQRVVFDAPTKGSHSKSYGLECYDAENNRTVKVRAAPGEPGFELIEGMFSYIGVPKTLLPTAPEIQ